MATYVNDLRLKEIATGDESGTWGASTNTNLELIAEAFSFGTEAITTNADTHTTTIADGSTDPGRSIYLKYTGTLDSACTITIGPNTVSKLWFIENGTSGSQNIIISQGSGANVTIPAGHVKAVYSDGAGSGAAIVDAFTDLNLAGTTTVDILSGSGNATIGGTLGVTGIVTLTDDLIIGDGKTIGSASDVDAMTIASNGQVTFSQTLIGTALDISGDIDVDGTSNLDVVDIDGAVDMASTLQVDGAITSSSAATITTADNNPQMTLVSTDADANVGPVLKLYRNSSSPADDDLLGRIQFTGEDDAGNESTFARINVIATDVSNGSEDARMEFAPAVADDFTPTMSLTSGNVGIGTSSPAESLHTTANIRLGDSAPAELYTNSSELRLGVDKNNDNDTSNITFYANNSEKVRIDKDGRVGIGETDPDNLLHLKSSNDTLLKLESTDTTVRLALTDSAGTSQVKNTGGKLILEADPSDAASNTYLGFEVDGSEHMRIDASGNVGIGTTSPSSRLTYSGSFNATSAGSKPSLTGAGSYGGGIGFVDTNVSGMYTDGSGANLRLFTNQSGSDRADAKIGLSIDGSQNVGIGTTSPDAKLHVSGTTTITGNTVFNSGNRAANNSSAMIRANSGFSSATNPDYTFYFNDQVGLFHPAADTLGFTTGGSEAMRIDSSGRLLVGSTTSVTTTGGTGASQVLGTGNSDTIFTLGRFSNNTGPAAINFIKSRNGTIGGNTIVQDDDTLGSIVWAAADGSDFVSHAAKIDARVDGTPGANDTPGRLGFFTTADGSDSAVERMRIDSSGNVITGSTTANASDAVTLRQDGTAHVNNAQFSNGNGSAGGTTPSIYSPASASLAISTNSSERMRIDGSGNLLVGVSTFSDDTGGTSIAGGLIKISNDSTSNGTQMFFTNPNGAVGSISSSGSATAYNTSSDARLKDVTGSARGLEVINELNPVAYNWKADGKADEGLIAQEVLDVVPNAVSGSEEDMYQMDYSKLVTHLVKAVQEQQEQIESLTSEIAILKEK